MGEASAQSVAQPPGLVEAGADRFDAPLGKKAANDDIVLVDNGLLAKTGRFRCRDYCSYKLFRLAMSESSGRNGPEMGEI